MMKHVCAAAILVSLASCGDSQRSIEGSPTLLPSDAGPPLEPENCIEAVSAAPRAVDIIVSIDQSNSMTDERDQLQANINLLPPLLTSSGLDYRVVMVAQPGRGGSRVCVPPPLGGENCGSNESIFRSVDYPIDSNYTLVILLHTLDSPVPTQKWRDFLRPNALKVFIPITDDESKMAAATFDNLLVHQSDGLFGSVHDRNYAFFPVIGTNDFPQTDQCHSASAPGKQYQELALLTKGIWFSVCRPQFEPIFQAIGHAIVDRSACEVAIPDPPRGATLDLGKINVRLVSGADSADIVPQDAERACADGADGWQFSEDKKKIRTIPKLIDSRAFSLVYALTSLVVACGNDGESGQVCDEGSRVEDACAPASPCPASTCTECPTGTFSTTTNAARCEPWRSCPPGSYVSAPGTAIADRQCTACAEGTYSSLPNQLACDPFDGCAPGAEPVAASATSPAVCQPCEVGTHCAGGITPKQACASGKASGTWDHDNDPTTACVPWTQCPPGSFVSTEGTAMGDRQCTECPPGRMTTIPNATECHEPPAPAQIVLGSVHGCALFTDGSVRCWGDNFYGQLGDGTKTRRLSPSILPGLSNVVDLAATGTATCAVLTDRSVLCWGYLWYGGLQPTVPGARIDGLFDVAELEGGPRHFCARIPGGSARCFGENARGQLGIGTTADPEEQAPLVPDLSGVVRLAVGGSGTGHTCALLEGGSVRCWGANFQGPLGDGTTTARTSPSTAVPGLSGVINVVAGGTHTCALLSGGTVQCWGANGAGQLGDGTRTTRSFPAPVAGLSNVTALAAGKSHTCARLDDGSAWCWGQAASVGDGNASAPRLSPVQVVALADVMQLASHSSADTTCALLADRSVRCWGANGSGQIGNGTTDTALTPTPVVW